MDTKYIDAYSIVPYSTVHWYLRRNRTLRKIEYPATDRLSRWTMAFRWVSPLVAKSIRYCSLSFPGFLFVRCESSGENLEGLSLED